MHHIISLWAVLNGHHLKDRYVDQKSKGMKKFKFCALSSSSLAYSAIITIPSNLAQLRIQFEMYSGHFKWKRKLISNILWNKEQFSFTTAKEDCLFTYFISQALLKFWIPVFSFLKQIWFPVGLKDWSPCEAMLVPNSLNIWQLVLQNLPILGAHKHKSKKKRNPIFYDPHFFWSPFFLIEYFMSHESTRESLKTDQFR